MENNKGQNSEEGAVQPKRNSTDENMQPSPFVWNKAPSVGLCKNGCGFFGSPELDDFCSKCFRELAQLRREFAEKNKEPQPVSKETEFVKEANIVCGVCKRRLKLALQYKCKCDKMFCNNHRPAEKHECVFDYKSEASKHVEKENPELKQSFFGN